MPWTRRQVRYLLSKGTPLTGAQKHKMLGELHANPAMGHARKGSAALKRHAPLTREQAARVRAKTNAALR